jgi:hypothetical protein
VNVFCAEVLGLGLLWSDAVHLTIVPVELIGKSLPVPGVQLIDGLESTKSVADTNPAYDTGVNVPTAVATKLVPVKIKVGAVVSRTRTVNVFCAEVLGLGLLWSDAVHVTVFEPNAKSLSVPGVQLIDGLESTKSDADTNPVYDTGVNWPVASLVMSATLSVGAVVSRTRTVNVFSREVLGLGLLWSDAVHVTVFEPNAKSLS